MPSLGMTALAQVTMSKLIGDYRALVPLLRDLGFSAVAFSYPQQARLGSSPLAWSSDSRLVNFKSTELVEAFDAVDDLRSMFHVNNTRASMRAKAACKSGLISASTGLRTDRASSMACGCEVFGQSGTAEFKS
jgi:hypothetical protein